MSRNGSGLYTLPAGSTVTDNVDLILASQHNTPLLDLQSDANIARPIVAGGTGATTAANAATALGVGAASAVTHASLTLTGVATLPAGAVGAASLTTTGDTNTGLYFPAADQVAVTTGGTQRALVSTTAITSTVPVVLPTGGTSSASNLNFGTANTGLRGSDAQVIFSVAGVDVLSIFQTQNVSGVAMRIDTNGSATDPALCESTSNSGIFFPSGASTAIAANNAEVIRFAETDTRVYQSSTNSPGQANTTTGLSWNSNGQIYSSADNTVGHAMLLNRNQNDLIVSCRRSGTQVGNISVTASNTAYNTSSDYRLKDVIDAPEYNAAEKVKALADAQCWFTWKVDGSQDFGWLAHELAEIEPRAVTGEKDAMRNGEPDYQGRDDSKLVVHLVAALADALRRIEALEAAS